MIDLTISHYRIIEKLGEGGMGVVYKAIDTKLDRTVALKFLAPHLVSNDESRQRFIREAKAAAVLQHPNICTVYEIDEVDGRTFIATAYLEGEELTKRIEKGPLSVERLLNIAIQVARGLQEAHSKGVVHRDIKPANIMLTTTGQAMRKSWKRLSRLLDRWIPIPRVLASLSDGALLRHLSEAGAGCVSSASPDLCGVVSRRRESVMLYER